MKTTLNLIKAKKPCVFGWKTLLTSLNKTHADDEPLDISHILKSNGLDDAIWCLRAVQGKDKELRLYAVWCARQVQHFMTDPRSITALGVAEKYANGEATPEELNIAQAAAHEAYDVNVADCAAADYAAYAATTYAAYAAVAYTASSSAYAASSAYFDAYRESREAQEARLIEICNKENNQNDTL